MNYWNCKCSVIETLKIIMSLTWHIEPHDTLDKSYISLENMFVLKFFVVDL